MEAPASSGIASAALGFSKTPALPHAELALCVIPFACLYVDLLCRNLSIRTKLLSGFIAVDKPNQALNDAAVRFEVFYQEFDNEREEALEGVALRHSTRAISAAIVFVAMIVSYLDNLSIYGMAGIQASFFLAGGAGWVLSGWLERQYQKQRREISRLMTEYNKK
jgi:hypothetical protein